MQCMDLDLHAIAAYGGSQNALYCRQNMIADLRNNDERKSNIPGRMAGGKKKKSICKVN